MLAALRRANRLPQQEIAAVPFFAFGLHNGNSSRWNYRQNHTGLGGAMRVMQSQPHGISILSRQSVTLDQSRQSNGLMLLS
jgi:hypothetical protein